MKHPFNEKATAERLLQEYHKYGKLVIGFDFDNTIYDYWNKGGDYSEVISALQKAKELGFILCLYTAETDKDKLKWKIHYCEQLGIKPTYVNKSPLIPESAKPFFSLLLDDRAGLESAYNNLKYVLDNANS